MANRLALTLRSKKLGILLRDARQAAGRTKRECAEAIGLTSGRYGSYENGKRSPSLPELEALAFFLDVPILHFWGTTSISENSQEAMYLDRLSQLLGLRQRMIATMLRKQREDARVSLAQLSSRSGVSKGRLKSFELALQPIPLPELEMISMGLGKSVTEFHDSSGPIGDWLREQTATRQIMEMPAGLQAFVIKPHNRPYLEIAQRLSELPVDRIRSVAEGLLEISL